MTCSMPRHCVEHLPCVHWTRPERAYCTSGARAAASRPALTPARDRPQPARRVPLHATCSPSPQRAKQSLAASPASQGLAATAARQPCSGQRRPSHPGSPPAPVNSANLSPRPSASYRRRHDALTLQGGGSPSSLSPTASNRPPPPI